MDQLIKQTKFKLSGSAGEDESSSRKDIRIAPRRNVSFDPEIEETEVSPSWFDGMYEIEQETALAVAAVAVAITSMEDSSIPENKMSSEFMPSFSRRTSRTGSRKVPTSNSDETSKTSKDTREIIGPGKISPAPDDEKPAKIVRPASQVEINPSFVDTTKTPDNIARPASQIDRIPSFADTDQTPTSADKDFTRTTTKKSYDLEEKTSQRTGQPEYSALIPTFPSVAKPGTTSTKTDKERIADKWEKQELAKIKERYEEVKDTILSWENKKKEKARNQQNKKERELAEKRRALTESDSEMDKPRLDRKKRELEKKMLKASEEYNSEIDSINQVAGGAHAKAAEKRRKEEHKAREKAKKIRETGKVPRESFCC